MIFETAEFDEPSSSNGNTLSWDVFPIPGPSNIGPIDLGHT